jgi:broad specificity phosphatase PhoE
MREVRSLADRIRRIHLDEIVSSPLERSVETASVIAEGRGWR